MTRKDFELIAAALLTARPTHYPNRPSPLTEGACNAWERCCSDIADTLQDQNSRFQRGRFLKACGMEG